MSVAVVMPAAGAGRRLGGVAKPFAEVAGRPLLWHTLRPFLECGDVASIVIALRELDARQPPAWLAQLDPRIRLVAGGEERGDSVRAALHALPPDTDVVLVHDGARPLVSPRVICEAIAAARAGRCAAVGVPVADTIQEVDAEQRIVATPERGRLWQAQTPQAFPRDVIVAAYRKAAAHAVHATDDAALVRGFGGMVYMIEGDRDNLKVTTPADLALADALLRART